MKRSVSLRVVGLRLFLGLVAINAALAIIVLLGGGIDDGGGRVLATSLLLTMGVMLGLACAAGQTVPRLGPAWLVGIAASAVGTGLLIALVWADGDIDVMKPASTCLVTAGGIAIAGLLGNADLPHRYRWCQPAAYALIAVLIAMAVLAIWGEIGSSGYWRTFGVGAVGLAALAIVIPVLHVVGIREARAAPGGGVGLPHCPRCGRAVDAAPGRAVHCPHCGLDYTIALREDVARVPPV